MTVEGRGHSAFSRYRAVSPSVPFAKEQSVPVRLWTVGHSTRSLEALVEVLASARITLLGDVRTVPRSRRHPHFNRETLPEALAARGIAYRHEPGLGGFRRPRPDSIYTAWKNEGFRGFADYMETEEFRRHLASVMEEAKRERLALMCAESVPWRCHRSLIADALFARGVEVVHLLGPGRESLHRLTPFGRIEGDRVIYRDLLE